MSEEIRKAREKTKGVIDVNVMVALSNYTDLVATAVKEKIDIIFSGAGLPLDLPKYLTPGSTTKLVWLFRLPELLRWFVPKWQSNYNYLPDAIVVEGPKAGGTLGLRPTRFSMRNIRWRDLYLKWSKSQRRWANVMVKRFRLLQPEYLLKILSVSWKELCCRNWFVTTNECDASEEFKQAYIKAKERVRIIKSPVGMPGKLSVVRFSMLGRNSPSDHLSGKLYPYL